MSWFSKNDNIFYVNCMILIKFCENVRKCQLSSSHFQNLTRLKISLNYFWKYHWSQSCWYSYVCWNLCYYIWLDLLNTMTDFFSTIWLLINGARSFKTPWIKPIFVNYPSINPLAIAFNGIWKRNFFWF